MYTLICFLFCLKNIQHGSDSKEVLLQCVLVSVTFLSRLWPLISVSSCLCMLAYAFLLDVFRK